VWRSNRTVKIVSLRYGSIAVVFGSLVASNFILENKKTSAFGRAKYRLKPYEWLPLALSFFYSTWFEPSTTSEPKKDSPWFDCSSSSVQIESYSSHGSVLTYTGDALSTAQMEDLTH
jgi:hypothetical protein